VIDSVEQQAIDFPLHAPVADFIVRRDIRARYRVEKKRKEKIDTCCTRNAKCDCTVLYPVLAIP